MAFWTMIHFWLKSEGEGGYYLGVLTYSVLASFYSHFKSTSWTCLPHLQSLISHFSSSQPLSSFAWPKKWSLTCSLCIYSCVWTDSSLHNSQKWHYQLKPSHVTSVLKPTDVFTYHNWEGSVGSDLSFRSDLISHHKATLASSGPLHLLCPLPGMLFPRITQLESCLSQYLRVGLISQISLFYVLPSFIFFKILIIIWNSNLKQFNLLLLNQVTSPKCYTQTWGTWTETSVSPT